MALTKPSPKTDTVRMRLTLSIPTNLLAELEREADRRRIVLEDLVVQRLAGDPVPEGILVEPETRREMEAAAGRNLQSADDLLQLVRRSSTVKVDGVDINLSSTLLYRLKTRCFGKAFGDFLREQIVRELEEFAGMR